MGRFRPDREGIVSPGPSAMFLRGNSALVEEMARTDSKILSLGLPEHRDAPRGSYMLYACEGTRRAGAMEDARWGAKSRKHIVLYSVWKDL